MRADSARNSRTYVPVQLGRRRTVLKIAARHQLNARSASMCRAEEDLFEAVLDPPLRAVGAAVQFRLLPREIDHTAAVILTEENNTMCGTIA